MEVQEPALGDEAVQVNGTEGQETEPVVEPTARPPFIQMPDISVIVPEVEAATEGEPVPTAEPEIDTVPEVKEQEFPAPTPQATEMTQMPGADRDYPLWPAWLLILLALVLFVVSVRMWWRARRGMRFF